MVEKLTMVKEIVSCLSGINVQIVSEEDGSPAHLMDEAFCNAVLPDLSCLDIQSTLAGIEENCIYMLTDFFGLTYIVIRMPGKCGYLLAGPCHIQEFSESRLRSHLRLYPLDHETIQRIVMYCRWQPQISEEKLNQLGMLLAYHLLGLREPVTFRQIEYHRDASKWPAIQESDQYVNPSQIRRIEMRYEASTVMTEAVKHGNLALAMRILRSIDAGMSSTVRSPDPLRNAQNFCIVLNTQLRHALEERKIHPYRLDEISNEIATHIETLKTLDEVAGYYHQIIKRYCELALETNDSHLDPLSRQAVVYIKAHLTDTLTVKDTAKALLVNANYLSGKFRKAMGVTFTDYVNQQRAEQAASLLHRTDLQIQQIAAAVGYNNASHFARQFLRFHGITPREYRNQKKP